MKIDVPKLPKLDEIGSCSLDTRLKVERQVKDWLEAIGIDTEHSIRNFKLDYNCAYHFWDIFFYKNNIVTDATIPYHADARKGSTTGHPRHR